MSASLLEIEGLQKAFDGVAALKTPDAAFLVVSEYAMTDVSRVIYPNRILRDAGMLRIDERDGAEHLNMTESMAFAVVDHQFAHLYVQDPSDIDGVSGIFEGLDGIADVLQGEGRGKLGVDHSRSGECILICEPDTWLAYYWWHDDAKAPGFARTVDIHSKPGYDPVEMFIDMPSKQVPLDAALVKGSHGAPADSPDQQGACIASHKGMLPNSPALHDTDIRAIIESAL